MIRRERSAESLSPVALEIFRGLFVSVCEEMGLALMRSASSPNIKERRDYSCAIFDDRGLTIAQGDHMPVHLGSMPASVQAALAALRLGPGDVAILNDPFHGGSHLPDITLVTPVFEKRKRGKQRAGPPDRALFYVACRAHHADVGGSQPGSMPLASEIYQEGLILPPVLLVRAGRLERDLFRIILANVRTPREREEDLTSQRAALHTGETRLREIVEANGAKLTVRAARELRAYSERMMRATLRRIPPGIYRFEDHLDDDGFGSGPIQIRASVRIAEGAASVDLRRSADQVRGGVNAVRAITQSAVLYVFRCLVPDDIPSNQGLAAPIRVLTRPGSVLDARPPAAVAAGNVETSQRVVDVLLGALARALPDRIPAASQGTMNNLTFGGRSPRDGFPFAYYETVAGGMGARPERNGLSGVHTHMTNSLNTPIEAIEQVLPLRVVSYTLRRGSGGAGLHRGGDGIVRSFEARAPVEFSILSDRRLLAPYGLSGGSPGSKGRNRIVRADGRVEDLPGKTTGRLAYGDRLVVESPGGGGWGRGRIAPRAHDRVQRLEGRRRASRGPGEGFAREPKPR